MQAPNKVNARWSISSLLSSKLPLHMNYLPSTIQPKQKYRTKSKVLYVLGPTNLVQIYHLLFFSTLNFLFWKHNLSIHQTMFLSLLSPLPRMPFLLFHLANPYIIQWSMPLGLNRLWHLPNVWFQQIYLFVYFMSKVEKKKKRCVRTSLVHQWCF